MTSAHPGPASTGPGPTPAGSGADPRPRDVDALAGPVAAAVLAGPSVAGLSGGPFGTVGTYLPGRRVTGVRITDDGVTVRIVARPVPLRTVEAEVRTAVTALVPGLPIHLGVDDLDIAGPDPVGT